MGFSLAPLLIHSPAVPVEAQNALRAASFGPPERRAAALESAARVLFRETELECRDAIELVGLSKQNSVLCGK
jgi:hypothetical protein